MKKIFVLFLSIFAMACFSMPAFAGSVTMGSTTLDLSANVLASYYGGTGTTAGTSYAATTFNPKGNGKAYGVASDTTYITYGPWATTKTAAPAVTVATSAAVGGATSTGSGLTGWKKLGE